MGSSLTALADIGVVSRRQITLFGESFDTKVMVMERENMKVR